MVDVREVADLHLRAMMAPDAAGQRYIAANTFEWMSHVPKCCEIACPAWPRGCPDASCRTRWSGCPAGSTPSCARLYELGKHRQVSADQALRDLGWPPRSSADLVVAPAQSLTPSQKIAS